jgi:hypothetical protein
MEREWVKDFMSENQILCQETIETANSYLGKMFEAITEITVDIQKGREDRGISICVELIDGLKWLIDALSLTRKYQESKGKIIDTGMANVVFIQIIDAFENRDYVFLSDLLEYELSPILLDWKNSLSDILQ